MDSCDVVLDSVDCDIDDNAVFSQNNNSESLSTLQTEAASLVVGLRANSSIPYNTIPHVVDSVNHMAASLTDYVQSVATSCMLETGIDETKLYILLTNT